MRSTRWTWLAGAVAMTAWGSAANGVDHLSAKSVDAGDVVIRRIILIAAEEADDNPGGSSKDYAGLRAEEGAADTTTRPRRTVPPVGTPFQGTFSRIVLELDDDTRIVVVVDRAADGWLSDRVYRGHLDGEPDSWFILVSNRGVFAGELSSSVGHYHIRYAVNGGHVLQRIDPSERLRCIFKTARGPGEAVGYQRRSAGGRGGGSLIDVMVVYTPSSRAAVGGTLAIQALIDSYIEYTNMAYEQSDVQHRFRLVHAREIDYVESGNSITDLLRLRDPNDGFMDDVHPLRDQWGADLVSLINTSGSAGVAFMMQVLSTAFAESAFSAIGAETGSIPGGLVFAHETAHNMGCSHNHFPGAPQGIFCYSFGFRTPDEQWRTIMSSSPGEFVDFFSSPDLSIKGMPLGVPGDGCPPDAAHNVRSLNEAAEIVAQFRPSTVPCGADFDCDSDVDLFDFAQFTKCSTGPDGHVEAPCAVFDFDLDGDVDWADFGAFQIVYTGPT